MKKILFAMVLGCGVWMGSRTLPMNSASAQITPLTGMVAPLTNGIGFTNTVIQTTNLSQLQISDVVALLLNLQTNVEETLPALMLVTSNVTFNAPAPTASQFHGVLQPITSGPPGLFSAQNAPGTPQQQVTFSLTVGTNTFVIDPPTLQALVELRDNLLRTLPVLQALNGTTPTNAGPVTFINPPITNFVPIPVTNRFFIPMTNAPPFAEPVVTFAP